MLPRMRGRGRIVGRLGALLLCGLLIWPAGVGARTIRTAAIVFSFEGETPPSNARDVAEAVLFGTGPNAIYPWNVRQYFQTVGYGAIDYAGSASDVYGPYEIGPNGGGCQIATWTNEATQEAEKAGFDRGNYEQLAYYLEPSLTAGCSAYGVGSVGFSFMKGISDYVTLHEFGHGLTATPGDPGSPHAGTLRCFEGSTPVAYSASCVEDEAGDPFDPMGSGRRGAMPLEMSAWRKLNFGAIPASDAPTIQYSGTYAIAPLEQNSGVRLLRVPNGAGQFLDLDFRQPVGPFDSFYSASEPATNGVAIHLDDPSFSGGHPSLLLDTTPETESFEDAPLTPGRQFRDFRTGVTIETLATGPAGATVKIGGLPDPPAPISCKKAGCKVPNLKRKKVKAARKAARKRNCKIGKVKRSRSRKVPEGRVISQKPKAGAQRREGTKVSLVVSSGPPGRR